MHLNTTKSNITNATSLSADSWNPLFDLKPEVIVNIVLFIILALAIILANLLVLASIRTNSRLRSPEYILILSLSLSDLMVGVFLIPARTLELFSIEYTRQFVWCKMTICLTLLSLSASLLNLLAVTMDRFLAISYSLKYKSFITLSRIYLTIAAVWITALTVSLVPLFGAGTKSVEISRPQHLCRFADVLEETYLVLYFVFICVMPTMLITVAYFKIFLLARSQERRIASLQVYDVEGSEQATVRKQSSKQIIFIRDSKAARTIAIVIGLFYLCWVPFFADILVTIFKQEAVSYLFTAIVSCIVYSNSAINPLVYGCLNQEFKNTYKRLVKRLFHPTRPRCLSDDATVTQVTIMRKVFEKNATVTATIPATQLETVSQNFRPGSCLNDIS
ncbi:adenosine receptor A2b-like [Oculina patagonica]